MASLILGPGVRPRRARKVPRKLPGQWEMCPKCKQQVPKGSRQVGALNRHDCGALGETLQDWGLVYKCTRCEHVGRHVVFTGLSNVGQWACRWHPGTYAEDTGYSCCGRRRQYASNPYLENGVWSRLNQLPPLPFEPEGCTACDHFHIDAPPATSALKRPLDVQQDLPHRVLALMTPPVEKRRGFRTQDGRGFLRGSASPAKKKRKRAVK